MILPLLQILFIYCYMISATTSTPECTTNSDCSNSDKICYEEKCLCPKHLPIEDSEQDRCLPHAELNEPCSLNEQCLGHAFCLDGYCSCGTNVAIPNPSRNISYCHPRRTLNQECNYDVQCPANSYCSQDKFGCLCNNGFAQSLVQTHDNVEQLECLPKLCKSSSECESEFHTCSDNKCVCLSSHFDIKTAKCYRFGSSEEDDFKLIHNNTSVIRDNKSTHYSSNDINSSNNWFKDLIASISNDLSKASSDQLWFSIIICLICALFAFLLIYILVKRPFKRWTAQKNEFEPNKTVPSNLSNAFNKNSINNKSFRKKSPREEDDMSVDSTGSHSSSNEENFQLVVKRKEKLTKTTTPISKTTGVMIDQPDNKSPDINRNNGNAVNIATRFMKDSVDKKLDNVTTSSPKKRFEPEDPSKFGSMI